MNLNNRIEYIDVSKAIGIIAIVAGHLFSYGGG